MRHGAECGVAAYTNSMSVSPRVSSEISSGSAAAKASSKTCRLAFGSRPHITAGPVWPRAFRCAKSSSLVTMINPSAIASR